MVGASGTVSVVVADLRVTLGQVPQENVALQPPVRVTFTWNPDPAGMLLKSNDALEFGVKLSPVTPFAFTPGIVFPHLSLIE